MGRKQGITLESIVESAAKIADRDGLESLTLKAVADDLGIQTPSLYNHVNGLVGLRRSLAMTSAIELSARFRRVEGGGSDRLRGIATAFRQFATEHPGQYASLSPAPKPGDDDELYAAMAGSVEVIAEALGSAGGSTDQLIHSIRALRAMLHGFVDLEAKGGFGMPVDLDESFGAAVDLVVAAIPSD